MSSEAHPHWELAPFHRMEKLVIVVTAAAAAAAAAAVCRRRSVLCRSSRSPTQMESQDGSGKHRVSSALRVIVLLALLIDSPGHASDVRRPSFWNAKTAAAPRDYERGEQERKEFFEVTKPVDIPHGSHELCSQVLLHHTFGNTINDPPTLRQYTPARHCGGDTEWTLVVLRWHATCKGRQFDRISAVWLSGVEIFRTCTAEPTPQGIDWTVEKDVTRFASLFRVPQLLALELANVVDDTYTGLYNVTLSAHFYGGEGGKPRDGASSYGGVADVILPFAEPSPLNGGYWFQLQNESDVHTQELRIPRNAYRSILEICVSFHGPDEFWYTNPPNDFLTANNLTDVAGNGTFREVLLSIDGLLAGVVYPFPVFYTGGVDPYFWRPITAIGSFVLPTYDVDVTPFLAHLVDGRAHKFAVTVTNALPYWLLSANLHLWLDPALESTTGALLEHFAPDLTFHTTSRFQNLDGKFVAVASRTLSYKGWIESSLGNLTTTASYSYRFSNALVYSDGATASLVHQESQTEAKVVVKSEAKDLVYHHRVLKFPLRISYQETDYANKTIFVRAAIEQGWQEDLQEQGSVGAGRSEFSTLRNAQRCTGELNIPPKGAISGVATTKQKYAFESSEGCYFRSVAASNYTFLYDQSSRCCSFTS